MEDLLDYPKFQHPSSICICGPTMAGKTTLLYNLLKSADKMFSVPPNKIMYCYGSWQPLFDEMRETIPNIKFIQGLPTKEQIGQSFQGVRLVILDDLMGQMSKDDTMEKVFTQAVHHLGLTLIYVLQNLFFKNTRTARINSHYIILFKNPADNLTPQILAKQICPDNKKFFLESLKDAFSQSHGYSYILLDLHQSTPDFLRLRTKILPYENTVVYVPKKT